VHERVGRPARIGERRLGRRPAILSDSQFDALFTTDAR
jgi:hypothetical protein